MNKQTEALKLALEALDMMVVPRGFQAQVRIKEIYDTIKEILAQPEQPKVRTGDCLLTGFCASEGHKIQKAEPEQMCRDDGRCQYAIDSGAEGMGHCPKGKCVMPLQPEQKPVSWKLVPVQPTEEMLKAMDECSTEGYDERLYAGHAASVYMAAVDVAPVLPQQCYCGDITRLGVVHRADSFCDEKPEQRPVAWMGAHDPTDLYHRKPPQADVVPLYTTPPQRTWVGLTDDERLQIYLKSNGIEFYKNFAMNIEAKLKDKNNA